MTPEKSTIIYLPDISLDKKSLTGDSNGSVIWYKSLISGLSLETGNHEIIARINIAY